MEVLGASDHHRSHDSGHWWLNLKMYWRKKRTTLGLIFRQMTFSHEINLNLKTVSDKKNNFFETKIKKIEKYCETLGLPRDNPKAK